MICLLIVFFSPALSLRIAQNNPISVDTGMPIWKLPEDYGLRFANLNMAEEPVMLTHILDASETKVTFILSQAFGLQSDGHRCTKDESCKECNRPFVDLNDTSFRCIENNDGLLQTALIEGYRPVEVDNCYQYHQMSTFAVTCNIDQKTNVIALQRDTSMPKPGQPTVYNYKPIEISRQNAYTQIPDKFNLAGCLLFNAAYSSWSMLFAQLAFQRLQGVDHIYVYDGTPQSLKSDITYTTQVNRLKQWRQYVTHMPWISADSLSEDINSIDGLQGLGKFDQLAVTEYTSYAHCHYFLRDRAHWIANNHVDEFISVQPKGPYKNVASILKSLPSDVGTIMFYAREVHASPTLDDANQKLLGAYVRSDRRNEIDNEDLFFTLAKQGHLWHTDLPIGQPLGWQGIYRPDHLESLHCQWGVVKSGSGSRTVLSDPEIGLVTEHIRTDASHRVKEGDSKMVEIMNHTTMKTISAGKSSQPFYYIFGGGREAVKLKSTYKPMHWFGMWGPHIQNIIKANGNLP